ncbi:hypothetical protein CLCR_03768 [Cladophialophora carrionii]|uniref:Uncharacterized protein n=1 Tax=Cladophialophora carrionii TaxID=86049 RepID=A0A1C1CH28_9EURO|nr:hypothetical protein CLCR_03768 [Cladophialophora carrionii]
MSEPKYKLLEDKLSSGLQGKLERGAHHQHVYSTESLCALQTWGNPYSGKEKGIADEDEGPLRLTVTRQGDMPPRNASFRDISKPPLTSDGTGGCIVSPWAPQ